MYKWQYLVVVGAMSFPANQNVKYECFHWASKYSILLAGSVFESGKSFSIFHKFHFVRQVPESQPDKSLAKSTSNVSAGVHIRNGLVKVKDTPHMNNNQPMAVILCHYDDVIMSAIASQITSLKIVYSTIYSDVDQRKTSKIRVTGLCVGNSPVTGEFPAQMASNWKMFPFDDVIMRRLVRPVVGNWAENSKFIATLNQLRKLWKFVCDVILVAF